MNKGNVVIGFIISVVGMILAKHGEDMVKSELKKKKDKK